MRELIHKLGQTNSVVILTIITVVFSILITFLAILLFNADVNIITSLLISASVAIIITPLVSWSLLGLFLRVDHLEREMRLLATFDALTGLLSRQAFFHDFKHYIYLTERKPIVFSLLSIDLDHFKNINDTHGHAAGDSVLKDFSEIAQSTFRRSDLLGRIGGEEFSVLLPNATEKTALMLAERLHSAIRKSVVMANDKPIKYTLSIGLYSFSPTAKDSIESILELGDKALYQAKEQGRDRTVIYNDLNDD